MGVRLLEEDFTSKLLNKSFRDMHQSEVGVCVSVGDSIENFEENTLRGHGTQVRGDRLVATVCGVIDRVNKLITVRTLHRRYGAEVGDVVIGRVTEIGGKRWRIDLQAKQEAQLMLSAVSLPGGVQRRRTAEDELQMREIFQEGDLISAEVQAVHQDGLVLLHTRSTRYGLLKNGQLIEVSPCLVKRQRQHMVNLDDYDVSIILGCNGLIWVGVNEGQSNPVNEMQFTSIARVCQTIRALAKLQIMISVDSILQATNLSLTENPVRPSGICNKEFLQMLLSGLT